MWLFGYPFDALYESSIYSIYIQHQMRCYFSHTCNANAVMWLFDGCYLGEAFDALAY